MEIIKSSRLIASRFDSLVAYSTNMTFKMSEAFPIDVYLIETIR